MKTIVKELKKYSLLGTVDQGSTKTTEAIISLVRLLAIEDFDCNIYRDVTNLSTSLVFFNGELKEDKGFTPKGPYIALAQAFDKPEDIIVVLHTPSYSKGGETVYKQEYCNYYLPDQELGANLVVHGEVKPC